MTDTLALRRELGVAVVARLRPEITGISAHVGEDYADGGEPEALLYRQIGAHFRWVAFAFMPWRSWDLHVGVVEVKPNALSVGFHISERAKNLMFDNLRKLGGQIGATPEHRPGVFEYQANLPTFDLAQTKKKSLIETISALCRAFAPVAAGVVPPREMGAG